MEVTDGSGLSTEVKDVSDGSEGWNVAPKVGSGLSTEVKDGSDGSDGSSGSGESDGWK
jgi:hypothetical protein